MIKDIIPPLHLQYPSTFWFERFLCPKYIQRVNFVVAAFLKTIIHQDQFWDYCSSNHPAREKTNSKAQWQSFTNKRSCHVQEKSNTSNMAFTGTYKLQNTEFYNEYLKALSKYLMYVWIFNMSFCTCMINLTKCSSSYWNRNQICVNHICKEISLWKYLI